MSTGISARFAFFPLVAICIFSCASAPPREAVSPQVQIKEIESSKQIKEMNENILISALSKKGDSYRDYAIGPDDLLEISVFDVEKLNKTVRVSSQGNISLPLIGILRVKGLTASELEKEIRDLLAEKYINDPQVSVFIKEFRSQRIAVMGAVDKPNVFDVAGPKRVLDMLAMAGGLKEDAGQLLFLIRPREVEAGSSKEEKTASESMPRTYVVDLEELLVKGDLTLNLQLLHGDVLNIPISGKVYIGGEVKTPGGFPLKGRKMTLGQAVTLAGGLKYEANGAETKIYRYAAKGTGKEILSIDVDAIQKGQKEDFFLKENDVVIVPAHGMKSFLSGFRDTVKGLVGFGVSLGTM